MIFHVLSVPVYPTKKEISICAFTQSTYKFCKSMVKKGHTVFHYGHPDSDVPCTKHFSVISSDVYDKVYGDKTWKEFHSQSVNNEVHEEFNKNAANLIKSNKQSDNDFVLAFWGFGHYACLEKLQDDFIIVEPTISYDSACAPYKVFPTYAQLHKMQHQHYKNNYPSFNDVVIPPGFYLEDFEYKTEKEDYILYLGRMIDAKGINIAQELSKTSQTKIKFVGPQNLEHTMNKDNPYAEYIHTVSYEERKTILANAKALIMPSLYSEPCGWTMIESFFSGTPVISTDWGGLAEYNQHGKTGYRCRSFNEFFHALGIIDRIDKSYCRKYAEKIFHIDSVTACYERYFENILTTRKYGFGYVQENCVFTVRENV